MNDITKTIIAAVVSAVIVGALFLGFRSSPTTTVVEKPSYGALAGPDIPSPYLNWGGLPIWHSSMDLAATSSVICSFPNPTNASTTIQATSTIAYVSVRVDNNPLGTQALYISTSTTAFGTSTPNLVAAASVGGSAYIAWNGSATTTILDVLGPGVASSGANGQTAYILRPGEFINVKIATTTAGAFATYMTGGCKAEFVQF